MSRFIQLHILTSYPPANLNRDDLGRPKTAKMGGVDRLRVSSQSLKRTWRTSELFQQVLSGNLGTRTKILGVNVYKELVGEGVSEAKAKKWSQAIAGQFGKLKKAEDNDLLSDLQIEQLVHISAHEQREIDSLVKIVVSEQREPSSDELSLLRKENMAADIALFGRMLASKPAFNVEAACQVAHAITVHGIVIEDDYFTAVDDLNDHSEDAGAAHIGETGFAAGLFYSYICINKELLVRNLNDDIALATKVIAALTEVAVKVAPEGKQNSFGSRAYASYVRAETGDQQPRSLSVAFLKPVAKNAEDYGAEAITALEKQVNNFDSVYGACADASYTLNVSNAKGSLAELLSFITE